MNFNIKEHIATIEHYKQALSLLSWDAKTFAPPNSQKQHATIQGTLSKELYLLQTDPAFAKELQHLQEQNLNQLQQKQVQHYWNIYQKLSAVPLEDYYRFSFLKASTHALWSQAREQNEFKLVEDNLQQLIHTHKRFAEYRNPHLAPYEQLLEEYEPGVSSETIDSLFQQIKDAIFPLLTKIKSSSVTHDTSFLNKPFSIKNQQKLGKHLLTAIGYNFKSGQIGTTPHPFSAGIHSQDARLAVRYDEHDVKLAAFMFSHEGGHSIYMLDTGLGAYTSMGLHESQSLFWERIIGKHEGFWRNHAHLFKELEPAIYGDISFETLYFALNEVTPSLIRLQADDLTYLLHIIIRYELERDLFADKLRVSDLSSAWNAKYEAYLGIKPKTDRDGVLQDGHWYGGAFGYFPSYNLGFIYAAQLREAVIKDHPQFDEIISSQNLSLIADWQKQHIHQYGKLKASREILTSLSIDQIDAQPLINYLTKKYERLYKL
ncbi:carboxypeptidase M32 [Priestia megaterium]|uniref:carboxypeptidase M32 n=1 Tax=Priestia megaterium TaxID=1404 RepID=UPI0026E11A73|nr:carboxypeptidase M32 [Priestia megaterium]MDO6847753.1 carboxypeptidase M32 [Priestia megaterium]